MVVLLGVLAVGVLDSPTWRPRRAPVAPRHRERIEAPYDGAPSSRRVPVMAARLGSDEPIRVVRIISRLNIGGPAIQAITLTNRLRPPGYETTLVRGARRPTRARWTTWPSRLDVRPSLLALAARDAGSRDLLALARLWSIMRRDASAHRAHPRGQGRDARRVGRADRVRRAAGRCSSTPTTGTPSLATSPRGGRSSAVRALSARRTDRLIAVSDEVRDDLVALRRRAGAEQFEVVRVGFDLSPF